MIWTVLPFGIVLLLIAGILLAHDFGAVLLDLLSQKEHYGSPKPAVRRRAAPPAAAIIYRGVSL
jgi:hypothetical protein